MKETTAVKEFLQDKPFFVKLRSKEFLTSKKGFIDDEKFKVLIHKKEGWRIEYDELDKIYLVTECEKTPHGFTLVDNNSEMFKPGWVDKIKYFITTSTLPETADWGDNKWSRDLVFASKKGYEYIFTWPDHKLYKIVTEGCVKNILTY